MKFLTAILFSVISFYACAQDTLDLPLNKKEKTIKYNCRKATLADVCKVIIYKTDSTDLFFKINYDKDGRIHSKGAVIKVNLENARSNNKGEVEYFEVGLWRYYNYQNNEIVYYRCVYSGEPGCSILTKEELKKEKLE